MTGKQTLIALGIVAATTVSVIAVGLALGRASPEAVPTAERLALAVRLMLVPALCLLLGVSVMAFRRYVDREAIDGATPAGSSAADINLRFNLNTLEQTVLAGVGWAGLALALQPRDLSILPVLAGLFAAGRATFWLGYLAAPWARAFGFALTFIPTAAALVWLAARAF